VSSKTRYIGAVEIGTSKIAVLIGELSPGQSIHLIGYGECQSHGVTKGVITDSKMAGDATHSALLQAEQVAGVKVDEVYLAQTGGHLDGFINSGTVNVSGDNGATVSNSYEEHHATNFGDKAQTTNQPRQTFAAPEEEEEVIEEATEGVE
jgi:cell division ATPase FtsA